MLRFNKQTNKREQIDFLCVRVWPRRKFFRMLFNRWKTAFFNLIPRAVLFCFSFIASWTNMGKNKKGKIFILIMSDSRNLEKPYSILVEKYGVAYYGERREQITFFGSRRNTDAVMDKSSEWEKVWIGKGMNSYPPPNDGLNNRTRIWKNQCYSPQKMLMQY